uniref:G-protein coupled receptors family 1 profile domain-containing protein n=1 Tax=Plectus sambesii TaxID=2011161 RepID=A0A914VV68_9BILA
MSDSPYYFLSHVIAGCLQFSTNLLICLVIGRFKGLRQQKEYCILFGLGVADCLDGLPSFTAGYTRLNQYWHPERRSNETVFSCMTQLHNVLWPFTDTAQSLMMAAVSMDRLFAVAFPLRYFFLTRRYAVWLVVMIFVYSLISAGSAWLYPLGEAGNQSVPATCYSSSSVGPIFNQYYTNLRVVAAWTSVVLYVLVILTYRYRATQVAHYLGCGPVQAAHRRKQTRLTRTLAVQCVFTFLLYILPTSIVSILPSVHDWTLIRGYLLVLTNANAIANLFLYLVRLKEFRLGFQKMIRCMSLPDSTDSWFNNYNDQPLSIKKRSDDRTGTPF